MVEAIESRELITVPIGEMRLRGTYHRTQAGSDSSARIGVLFVNSGYAPRAAFGDSAVYWADAFANCGFPSFRLDLPGLGDSEGELPETWLELSQLINDGHFASYVSNAAKSLTERFRLSGVVIIGHCAGAISAVYAGAESKYIKGVVALDPYFFRNEEVRPAIRQGISVLVTRNKVAGQLSKVYRHLKKVGVLVRGAKLPANTNLTLVRNWNRLASAGIPMLVVNARGPSQSRGQFDYFRYLQQAAGGRSRVAIRFINGAHHSFADNVGKVAVRRFIEQWLNASFPRLESKENTFAEQLTVNRQI